MKDAALSKGVKIAINTQIKEYGQMLKLNLNSEQKSNRYGSNARGRT